MEVSVNDIESSFCEVTDRAKIDNIFAEAAQAECVGAALSKDAGNVLPLFAHPSGFGRIAIAYGTDKIYTIPCDMDTDMDYLFEKLSEVAERAVCFSMCGLKDAMSSITGIRNENGFDVVVAAYLLNPLKSDYSYEDVARRCV